VEDAGSAPIEFALVGALLTVLTLAVLQLALALHVRTTVLDSAAEGARFAALADRDLEAGAQRTDELITAALGGDYGRDIRVGTTRWGGVDVAVVTVTVPLPLLGLIGVDDGLEVSGHAPLETIER
jgi:hypothetical protein